MPGPLKVDASNSGARLGQTSPLKASSALRGRRKGYFALLTVVLGGLAAPGAVPACLCIFCSVLAGVLKGPRHRAGNDG